ncbi:hypothetical protein CAPTEDRAFT_23442, partial [Capitella teleta]
YNVSVVRTIEKRFSLTSTQTGMTWSMNDITHICLVTFVAYFAQKSHIPRVLSVTMSFSAVAATLMVLPFFLYPVPKEIIPVLSNNQSSEADICVREFPGYSHDDTQCTASQTDQSRSSRGAWFIFLFAQLLNGVGGTGLQTLGLAYIDENVSKSKSSLYVGIVTSMYAFGPIIGLLLSAVALQFPESPWEGNYADGTPKDPMWIGCWWSGFAACAVLIIIAVIPMWFFPRSMSSSPSQPIGKTNRMEAKEKIGSALGQFKAFPKSLMSLLSNKAYMTLLIMVVCMAYIIQGVFSQLVRYIEIHFMVPAFTASIVAAVVSAGAGALGGFTGGVLMTWWKLTPRGAAWMLTVSMGATAAGIAAAMLMGSCININRLHVGSPCSESCACEEGKPYNPVCGSDGLTYFSPCHAGCTSLVNETYRGCSCLNATGAAQTAISGHCHVECNLLVPYAIVMFLMCFLGSVARVPGTILQFRMVKPEEKSFALGLISFAMNLLALIPGPVLFGSLVDKSCILWQKTCSGGSGVCLLFDTANFR